jgi:flagellar biosynthesis GTPase FlhF
VAETVSHLLPFGSPRQLKRLVRTALARQIPVQAPRALGGATVAFVGAGGSGKTLSTARVAAAYASRSDLPVVCLSLRPRDGGAALRALLEPAGIAVEVVETAAEARARADEAGRALVVVDTAAVSPSDAAGLRALGAELRKLGGVDIQVCVPATLSAVAAGRLLDALAPLDPAGLVLTHVDETPQVGQIVELAIAGRAPLSFVGRDTALDDGLTFADPTALAALVLP